MLRVITLLLSLVFLTSACSDRDQILSQQAFTRHIAARIREAQPGAKVIVKDDLQLAVTLASGSEQTIYLDNCYNEYKADTTDKDAVVARYLKAFSEVKAATSSIDRTRIVPIIKDRPWIDEVRKATQEKGKGKEMSFVSEPFNEELTIVYAEDSPSNLRYLTAEDLNKTGLKPEELRPLAIANLRQIMPKIETHGSEGLYMLTAGGDFEVSLLLFDEIWHSGDLKVKGDYVVAIPSRDLLLITGSEEAERIPRLREKSRELAAKASYRLTTDLFVYRNGRFVRFDP